MKLPEKSSQNLGVSGYFPAVLAFLIFYLILFMGLSYYEQRHQKLQLLEFSGRSTSALEMMSIDANYEQFWARNLVGSYKGAAGAAAFLESLKKLRAETGEKLSCVIWEQTGQVFMNDHFDAATIPMQALTEMYHDLRDLYHTGKSYSGAAIPRLQKLLGPNIDADRMTSMMYQRHLKLLRPDSAGKFSEFWVGWGREFSVLVFVDLRNAREDAGLARFAKIAGFTDMQIGFFHYGGKSSSEKSRWIEEAVRKLELDGRSAALIDGIMVAGKRIAGKKLLYACKSFQPVFNPGRLTFLLAIFSLFGLLLVVRSAGDRFRLDKKSVNLQLLLMLMVTTGLPLMLLALAASDHVSRKRNALIENAYQTCIGYIQHVDRRSLIINSSINHKVNRLLPEVRKKLPAKFGSHDLLSLIRNELGDSMLSVRLIASSPARLMSEEGVLDGGRFSSFKMTEKVKAQVLLDLKVSRDIAATYLAEMNNQPAGSKITETELVAEMVYQRPFHEIIQSMLLATDKIFRLGLFDRATPLLVKLISLNNDSIADYFFMFFFQNGPLQKRFLAEKHDSFQRNHLGVKFLYANDRTFGRDELLISSIPWFSEIVARTGEHPAVEPCFTRFDGKEYIYAGMRGQNLDNFSLFAFYPLEKIEEQIAEEKQFILSAAIITIIMLSGLGLIFSSSFVLPLSMLQAGAIAIRRRDFSFRLSELSADEFGEMARIFNTSMADFEELSLAGIVQARLLPQQGISDARFDLFGRSVPMTEMGGDYFDYFMADDRNLVVMAGDVAGHGVGASLIMAMAKAGILRCRECLHDPAAVLTRMHQIIFETRTKAQRKVMTFQYLYFNADSGTAVYSNAGACSPILVDSAAGTATEVPLQAPVLGGFKKSKFSNLDLALEPGQALVFYTDGIIETMNPEGREIGYEGFKQMLLACFEPDAKSFYEKVYHRYSEWLGGGQPQDDLTLIVLVRRH